MPYGELLRLARQYRGFNQRELARRLLWSPQLFGGERHYCFTCSS